MSLIYKKFKKSVAEYSDLPIVYWKEKIRWQSMTYRQFSRKVDSLAAGLFEFGVKKGEKVAIFSENRPEWLMSDLAINKIGAVSVPIHITSKKDLVEYIIKDSESNFLITSESFFDKNKDWLLENKRLKNIFLISKKKTVESEKVISFRNLLVKNNKVEYKQDYKLASIIYTSGTTGDPKGVMLSNKNFLSNINGVLQYVEVKKEDRFLSFLPLSHVLERTAGSYIPVFCGSSIAYAENIKKLEKNLGEIKPTILVSVPKIFERIYEKIFVQIKEKPACIRNIFFKSLKKENNFLGKIIAEKIIFSKIRKIFGGKLRFAVSGGASINGKILKFFDRININIIEGYGLTETSPIISVNSLDDKKIGTVGKILKNVKVKIGEDKEILVKGNNVMAGYWNNKEKTAEEFDEKQWFKTGDLGFLDNDDFLSIIGRKKEIIVTRNGKNISPEKLESLINLDPFIEQSIVIGHNRNCLIALLVPDFEAIKKKLNIEKADKDNTDLIKIINKSIKRINKDLPFHEQIRKFEILNKAFSIEENELTPTLKIRRMIIEDKYSQLINDIYNRLVA